MVSLQTRVRSRAHDDPERQTTDDLFLCYVPSRNSGESHLGGGSTHAWCQIYLPGSGWVEFDPTNGIVGNRDLIRVAVARDARQASPLHGSYFRKVEDEEGMVVSVRVRRLPEQEPSTHVRDDAET